jgi:uncharacterized protein (DUF2384 family)
MSMQPLVDLRRQPPASPVEASGYTSAEIRAMQRTVGNIFARWGVTDGEAAVILGGISAKTFRRWREEAYGRVNRDLADRLSLVLGIHKALRIIFREPAAGYDWMRRPNAELGGVTPVALLQRGGMGDLERLRRYLDAVRGGW